MDFNFRAPSPMFKEMNRLESPSLFFDDFKVDVNVSPSRFFTTTPPLWSPTKSLQESSSPTKSLLTNESPTFNCFVDNIQPNGLIPFKPQVVKLEDNLLTSSIERPNVSTTEETQQQKNPLLNLESKGGAFEKFNKPGLDINNNQTNQQNSFLNSAFSKIENSINIPESNPLVKLEHPTTTNNPNPTNMTNNNNTNNNNLNNNTNNNNNNLQRNNNNPPGISNNSMFNNLSQQNKNMPNPFFPNDFSGMNLMFGGGPNSAFSKMDNMPLFNQSLMTNGFPSNGMANMGNMNNMGTNMKQGQGFHPNMMQMNPAMMQMMQMQMQMQNPNLLNIHPNNNNGNNTNNNNNLNNNLNNLNNNLNNTNNMNNNPNNNLNNMNNNMKQMGGGDSRFIKFESIVPMMNSTDNNKPNMSPNMNPNFNNMNPNMFFSVPTNPNMNNMNNMNNINMNLNPNLNGNFLTRAKNPLEQTNEEKNVPNKRQKNKKSTDTKNTKNKDTNKHIKPKFTTEVNKNDLDLIQKKRTLDTQSPTFTDDGHLKNRVKEKKEVPDKIQCLGSSKKKGTQCKNAALLEFIGPRPLYCAEHIEEDKNTLHGKCKCTYFKEKGDGKPCKQIILKELVMCYRHFDEVLPTLTLEKARRQKNLVVEMIKKLRQDSKTFLKTNIDLYQRKSKLLPKYIKLDNILAKFIAEKEKTE